MIFDEAGNLIWFQIPAARDRIDEPPGPAVQRAARAHLVAGSGSAAGLRRGRRGDRQQLHQQIRSVRAGDGDKADLHDFHITAQNTALITVFDPIYCNLSQWGGPQGAGVTDSVFEELDLGTGLVRREWHSVDHVALSASYSSVVQGNARMAVRLLSPQLDRSARRRHDADLGAQHVGAVSTEHADRAGAREHRRKELHDQAGPGRGDGLPARRRHAAERGHHAVRQRRGAEACTRSRAGSCRRSTW